MAKSKTLILALFLYFVFFPFGQLPRLIADLTGLSPFLHITDAIIFIYATLHLARKIKSLPRFLLVALFSYILATSIWGFYPNGLFYLLRLSAYIVFFLDLANFLKSHESFKPLLIKSAIAIGTTISLFGYLQYLFFPDLRALYTLGWDDHLYRLTSTFLDPAFTGILLVLTLLALIFFAQKKFLFPLFIFNLFALVLTFSRSSYLALLISLAYIFLRNFSQKLVVIFIFALISVVAIAPKPDGVGVNLLRTHSIIAKIDSYKESFSIIKKSPVFGVGFNNLCQFKENSHACSGLDNSFLFILATTGLIGFVSLVHFGKSVYTDTSKNKFGLLFKASAIGVLVHSLFTNTLFYPWVMGWLGVLYALSRSYGE